jgi:hypothetical protein
MSERPEFSLQKEIQKRKSQEMPPVIDPKRTSQAAIPVRKTQTATILPAASVSVSGELVDIIQRLNPKQRLLIGAVAAILLLTCVGVSLMAALPVPSAATPTPQPLPSVKASDVIAFLMKEGVTLSSVKEMPVEKTWAADQEIQFNLQSGNDKGTFLVMSYATPEKKVPDMFKVSSHAKYKTWQVTSASNIVLLAAPGTSDQLKAAMEAHLAKYLVVPYREFLQTPKAIK